MNVEHASRGRCLCGAVEYELPLTPMKYYQCHCSLCQKQSGAASNCGTLLPQAGFRWLRGEALVKTWRKATGFSSAFCSQCGAPVPNMLQGTDLMFIPVGSLLEAPGEIVAHLFCSSRATWETATLQGECHDAMPPLDTLLQTLAIDV